uniref:Ubiquitin-like protease family profile domain-containing protein n=1 Tax=Chenopodium quinoa TaxID=63459 RepID=A0A803MMC8_CHEQI
MVHMLCFIEESFNGDLGLANKRKLYRAEICASLVLSDIISNRDAIVDKVSKLKVSKKLDVDAEFSELKEMIYVSDFLKENKGCVETMSLQFNQVIDYISINDYSLVNKSEVAGWFGESIEITREVCNSLLDEWKVTNNLITAWAFHLNCYEKERERPNNQPVRFYFGFDHMEALTICLRANGKRGVTQLQKTWEEWTKTQALNLDAAECIFPMKKEDHYFVVVINFRNETIDQLDSTE